MSEQPTERLDVPVAPIGGGRGRRSAWRRFLIAGVAAVAVAGWWALTIGPGRDIAGDSAATTRASGIANAARSPSASPARTPREQLPVLADVPLPGAPAAAFVVRDGQDADLIGWRPGMPALESIAAFPGAFGGSFAGADSGPIILLSPDLASVLLVKVDSVTAEGADTARLVARDGIAWELDGVTGLGGVAWSADGSRLAMTGGHDRWLLAERRALPGTWTKPAEIDVSAGRPAEVPGASPRASLDPAYSIADRIAPVGFSGSGDWIIGARLDPAASAWVPAVRVGFGDGRAEAIRAFPIGGPDGLPKEATQVVDVATGRTLAYGPNADIPGGPPQLEVREPGGTYAFGVRTGVVMGWSWTGDGGLVVLAADGAPFPARWTLQLVQGNGSARTLVEAPRASLGAFLGVRDGYAGLLFVGREPARDQIVVVRLADGAASAITVKPIGGDGPLGGGWAP
jgi:hypothetical protein